MSRQEVLVCDQCHGQRDDGPIRVRIMGGGEDGWLHVESDNPAMRRSDFCGWTCLAEFALREQRATANWRAAKQQAAGG